LIIDKLKIGTTLRRIIKNIGWLFFLRVIRFLFSIFITAWVARYLGSEMFGIYRYGIAFVGLLSPLAILGLEGIIVRDIVREPESKDEILGTAFLLRLVSGAIGFVLVLILIYYIRREDFLVRTVTGIVALTLIFQTFRNVDLWFQSQIQSKYTVITTSVALTLASLLKIVAIKTRSPVTVFAIITVLEVVFLAAGLVVAYRSQGLRIRRWRFSIIRAKRLIAQSWTLILSGTLAVIYFKIDQVMIGEMVGETEVGIYSIAAGLSELWYFIPIAITTSVFPTLIASRERGIEIYKMRQQQLYDLLAWLALAVAVIFTFSARPVILLLFGRQYEGGIPILSVHIWAGLFVFLNIALGRWLLNENELKFLLISNALGATINILLNLWFIPLYGGMGAAVATIFSYAFAAPISCFLYKPTRIPGWMMVKAIFVPVRSLGGLIKRMKT
jgi:PST family polysaccharide transporter